MKNKVKKNDLFFKLSNYSILFELIKQNIWSYKKNLLIDC